MSFWELLLLALVGWTGVGALGVALSMRQGQRTKVWRHLAWIVGVWVVYLAALAGTSLLQPQRVVAMGQEQCFDDMCFAVTGAEEVPGFLIHDGSRLLRVSVRISNRGRGRTQSEGLIQAYLVDAQGRRWEESPGISGVRLTARVTAGSSVVSEPVFKVAKDASGLELIFTHGWKQPGILMMGAPDSLWHKRTVVPLGR
ncbi:MAG: hypothetical protein JWQ42_537 [Edaphobacter sp.]|jgi:hypothetical protein|nr:hypothetical protein [Edaphobacter sp.]